MNCPFKQLTQSFGKHWRWKLRQTFASAFQRNVWKFPFQSRKRCWLLAFQSSFSCEDDLQNKWPETKMTFVQAKQSQVARIEQYMPRHTRLPRRSVKCAAKYWNCLFISVLLRIVTQMVEKHWIRQRQKDCFEKTLRNLFFYMRCGIVFLNLFSTEK